MYDIMDNILTNDLEVTRITLPDIVKSLNSKLQVSLVALNEMFKLATSDIAKVHNVRREPFKVIRT